MSGTHAGGSPGLAGQVRRALRDKTFLAALALLTVAGLGLNASVRFMQLYFKKEPVPIAKPFKDVMPQALGSWVQVSRNDVLAEDFLEALGTQEYLFCYYVNTAAVGKTAEELHKQFDGLEYKQRQQQIAEMEGRTPAGVLYLGLTYYTGKADTVAHVPERCYTAAGYDPLGVPELQAWQLGARTVDVRYAKYGKQNQPSECNVAYFFYVNDERSADSLIVRERLQSLRQRYGYYAKVELTARAPPQDQEKVSAAMKDFLGQAMPHIEQALPDWSKYGSK